MELKFRNKTNMPKYDIYCQEILNGHLPVDILYESDRVLAFYHTKPKYATHIVILPKQHIDDFAAFEDQDLSLMQEILVVARNLSRKLGKTQGIRLVTNLGKFQDSPHLHFHLISGQPI